MNTVKNTVKVTIPQWAIDTISGGSVPLRAGIYVRQVHEYISRLASILDKYVFYVVDNKTNVPLGKFLDTSELSLKLLLDTVYDNYRVQKWLPEEFCERDFDTWEITLAHIPMWKRQEILLSKE